MNARAGGPRASQVPLYAHCLGLGQAWRTRWPCSPGLAPLHPRTFMRSRFLDNFVLRSAAMLASAVLRAPSRARPRMRTAAYAAASSYVARVSLPRGPAYVARVRACPGVFARSFRSPYLTLKLGVRARLPMQR